MTQTIIDGLTRTKRRFLAGRHDDSGNPWPFISMSQRGGGATSRMFASLQEAGLYDERNCLTPLGQQVAQELRMEDKL